MRTGAALWISRRNLPQIVAVYLVLYAVAVLLLALLVTNYSRVWSGSERLPQVFLLLMLAPADLLAESERAIGVYSAVYIAEVLRVVLPVFLLGAFVFKLFRIDPLTWRGRVSLEPQVGEQPPVLRIRFYNSTTSPLMGVRIQVFARVRSTGTPRVVRNLALGIAQGEDRATGESAYWAFSRPGVPFTVNVPLGMGLTALETVTGQHLVLPNHDVAISRDRVKLFALATGTSLETGTTFTSGHEYDLSEDVLLGHYGEIDVVYDQKPRLWKGWDRFEESSELFVFGYASLVSPDSVERTLGHPVDSSTFMYAKLANHERTWTVGSDKSSHPERTFWKNDGSEFTGVTVVMGITRRPSSSCDGAVFPVYRGDLSVLDVRERNYSRVDVSDLVTWAGKPSGSIVFTYVPLPDSERRIVDARNHGKEVIIRQGYLTLVRKAFLRAGYPQGRPELNDGNLPYEVADLSIKIDESVQAVIQGNLAASYFQGYLDESPS